MPSKIYVDCKLEGDLASSALSYAEEAAEVLDSLLNQITAINFDTSEMDAQIEALNNLLNRSPVKELSSLKAMSDSLKIPDFEATRIDEEKRLMGAGIAMVNGQVLIPNTIEENIVPVRTLYRELDNDIASEKTILADTNLAEGSFFQIVYKIDTTIIPPQAPNRKLSVDDVSGLLGYTVLPDEVSYTAFTNKQGDKQWFTTVAKKTFIGKNINLNAAATKVGVPVSQLGCSVYWVNDVAPTNTNVTRLKNFAITGEKLDAAILGENLRDIKKEYISLEINNLVQEMDKVVALFEQASDPRLSRDKAKTVYNKIDTNLRQITDKTKVLQGILNFKVFILSDKDIFTAMTEAGMTEANIKELFEQRSDIKGLRLNAQDSEIRDAINNAVRVPADSTTMSTYLLNQPEDDTVSVDLLAASNQVDSLIKQFNNEQTKADLQSDKIKVDELNTLKASTISIMEDLLAIDNENYGRPRPEPVNGFRCYDNPSSIMLRRININASYKFDLKFNMMESLLNVLGLGEFYRQFIAAIVWILRQLTEGINIVLAATNKSADFIKKLEAVTSANVNLTADGNLDTGLFQCAFNFELGLDLNLLAPLKYLPTITNDGINSLLVVNANILNDYLCKPIQFINMYLQSLQTVAQTIGCSVTDIDLPQEIQDAMAELRAAFLSLFSLTLNFKGNLIKAKTSLSIGPDNISSVESSFSCLGKQAENFQKATELSFQKSIG